MNKVSRYKIWLRAVCKEYNLTQKELMDPKPGPYSIVNCARHTFYWLCFRDRIDLYRLSEHLGKHRTTVISSMKKNDLSNKDIGNKIWTNVKTRETEAGLYSSNQ